MVYAGACYSRRQNRRLRGPWLTQNAFTMANAHFIFVFAMVHANAFPMVNTKKKCVFAMLGT